MRINNNLMAYNAQNKLGVNNNSVSNSIRKLSSGLKISRAGDDAAGLAISEKMRAQINGLDMASKNSQDAISLIQTAEGGLNETHAILQRMRELAVQSASDTNQDAVDREALHEEFSALRSEIDDIANNTQFNNQKLLDGTFGTQYSIGADTTSDIQVGSNGITSVTIQGFVDTNALAGAANDTEYEVTIGANASNEYTATLADGTVAVAAGSTNATGTPQTVVFDFGDGRSITIEDQGTTNLTTIDNDGGAGADGELFFSASGDEAQIQTGANEGEKLAVTIGSMKADAIGTSTNNMVSDASVLTRATAEAAITIVDDATNDVSTQRSKLGALQNRLEHKIKNLDTSSENLQAAESRIRDLDMAAEMTEFTSANILSQAATSMLAQANSLPQNVLKLLG